MVRQKQKDRQEELEREASELSEKLKQTQIELDTLTSTKKMLEIALTNTSHSQHKPASTKDVHSLSFSYLFGLSYGLARPECGEEMHRVTAL